MESDSEDEDLKRAIALSLQDQGNNAKSTTADPMSEAMTSSSNKIDLKALHEMRMARSAAGRKRERSISPPALGSRKSAKVEESSVSLPSGAMLRSFTTTVKQEQAARKPAVANAASSHMASRKTVIQKTSTELPALPKNASTSEKRGTLIYPDGVVKRTWAFGHARTMNDIKLEEVLESNTLSTAVISAYQWDPEWILSKLQIPPRGGRTKCIFIMQAADQEMKSQMTAETEHMRGYLQLCFPFMQPSPNMYSMHSKLMLLFHKDKLRIAVPTANMLNFDWGETGVMENMVFLIDLPRLPDGFRIRTEDMTFFGQELVYFLKRQGLDQQAIEGVHTFDFTATAGMAFVHTIGGMTYKKDVERTGWTGLSRAVRHLNLQTEENLHLDFLTSSCGVLNDTYLQRIHDCSRGRDLLAEADAKAAKDKATFFNKKPASSRPKSKGSSAVDEGRAIRSKLHTYFPTQETVRASTAGAVGTVCLDRKTWAAAPFPRDVFRDYTSIRRGLLSHSKILYARGKSQVKDSKDSSGDKMGKDVAWVYIGSANISQAAWGETPKWDEGKKEWRVWGKNWECGVLLPARGANTVDSNESASGSKLMDASRADDGDETQSEDDTRDEGEGAHGKRSTRPLPISVFDDVLPVPCQYPGAEYRGREPWFFKEEMK
ncbi:phospholipase D/nuclease [Polychaeton citri CBS 116435]|uniref:Phospholipase D/nuclease n=1 Tax=Polychaeton citri CBS 116435 TaxID=1314669 RepID=A0A9P4Q4G0_9PEZI|nr:phospholipase D/nuclease [Polychaeton citri CBS 116435]